MEHDKAPHKVRLIAVTGGIGSGKSVVCRMLLAMGYKVYDCDSRAKAIMDADAQLIAEIGRTISVEVVRPDGRLDRPRLAAIVFADSELMKTLNALVHDAVKADVRRWAEQHAADDCLFVETAILCTSGMDAMVDDVWLVTAPENMRKQRVMDRNGLDEEQVIARMKAQEAESCAVKSLGSRVREIVNDGHTALLPQVLKLLKHHK